MDFWVEGFGFVVFFFFFFAGGGGQREEVGWLIQKFILHMVNEFCFVLIK